MKNTFTIFFHSGEIWYHFSTQMFDHVLCKSCILINVWHEGAVQLSAYQRSNHHSHLCNVSVTRFPDMQTLSLPSWSPCPVFQSLVCRATVLPDCWLLTCVPLVAMGGASKPACLLNKLIFQLRVSPMVVTLSPPTLVWLCFFTLNCVHLTPPYVLLLTFCWAHSTFPVSLYRNNTHVDRNCLWYICRAPLSPLPVV